MKILFISHSYPPTIGGVESQNFNLAQGLSEISSTHIIANGKGKIWLPIFIPLTFFKAFFLMMKNDVCIIGSGVLSPFALALKFFHPNKKFFSIVHGLDVTFAKKAGLLPKIYKAMNIPSLQRLDKLFMVGNFTIEEAVKVGISRDKCVFIPNGVNLDDLKKNYTRDDLANFLGKDIQGKKIILRLGRFVPHKGTEWFIRKVMPLLSNDTILVASGYRVDKNTIGDPDNFEACEKAVKENNLEAQVKLMPNLAQEKLEVLLNTADLVVSPNINYPGSSEGFGINVIEAAACERVVVASNLQGLADAIKDGKNGFLAETENIDQWVKKINAIFSAGPEFSRNFGKKAASFVRENFTWEKISKEYLKEIEKVTKKH